MTETTVLARNYKLGRAYHADGWRHYIKDGAYTERERHALVNALIRRQVKEFNRLLPKGCYWNPRLGEIHGPTNASLDGIDLDLVLAMAADAVAERFEKIETKVLRRLSGTR